MTLIEMLVAIAVIGIGVVGIAYGFSAVVRSSGDTQGQATLDGAAQYLSDYVADLTYSPCATSYPAPAASVTYRDEGVSWLSSFPVAVARAVSSPDPTPGYPSLLMCSDSTADYGVQEITIAVIDHGLSVTQVVWKDDLSKDDRP
jgi:prepilin-type N-terminal cleavage/methylation domain-containing protein